MTSLVESGQQWDAPNAWPPLQALLVEGLATYGGTHSPAAVALMMQLIAATHSTRTAGGT